MRAIAVAALVCLVFGCSDPDTFSGKYFVQADSVPKGRPPLTERISFDFSPDGTVVLEMSSTSEKIEGKYRVEGKSVHLEGNEGRPGQTLTIQEDGTLLTSDGVRLAKEAS